MTERKAQAVGLITIETHTSGRVYREVQTQSVSLPLPAALAIKVEVGKKKTKKVLKIDDDGNVVVEDESPEE